MTTARSSVLAFLTILAALPSSIPIVAATGNEISQNAEAQSIAMSDWDAIKGIMPSFFETLGKASARDALQKIKERFPVDSSSGELLAVKIDELLRTFGRIEAYELVGVRSIPRSHRLYQVGYLTYNSESPALWEATFYRQKTGWIMLKLSFTTEGIFEAASHYR